MSLSRMAAWHHQRLWNFEVPVSNSGYTPVYYVNLYWGAFYPGMHSSGCKRN